MTPRTLPLLAALGLLAGCSAHSPFIIKNTVDTELITHAPPYSGQVFVTEQGLPAGVQYETIATIDVGKVWYGSDTKVLASMADRARELGANALIGVKTWHQTSGYAWAAPHGTARAVCIKDLNQVRSLPGEWY